MARVSKQEVEHIANLAQLTLDDAAQDRLVGELNEILTYVEKLGEIDTANVEPMMHALQQTNVFRDDVAGGSLDREEALRNAPKSDGEYFIVPRILDSE